MRIVFMGSPEFAVPSLDILIKHGYEVVGVITATDKLGGRGGKKLLKTAVKKYAEEHNIPVLQPKNLKSAKFINELKKLKADLQIVVAFRMLPEIVWNMPRLGTYNLHGSLLPAYRGAAPINWAVIRGEATTGVTTFKLQHKIDTGAILLQRTLDIEETDTAGDVYEKLMMIGSDVVLETVQKIESGSYELIPQDDSKASDAPKIYHETCKINWDQETKTVYNFIRGMSPFPSAWTSFNNVELKIIEAMYAEVEHTQEIGTFEFLKKELRNYCKDGYITPTLVQQQGKRKMNIVDFLNGFQK